MTTIMMSRMLPISRKISMGLTTASSSMILSARQRLLLNNTTSNRYVLLSTTTTLSSSVTDETVSSTTPLAAQTNSSTMNNENTIMRNSNNGGGGGNNNYKPRYFKNEKPIRSYRSAMIINKSIAVGKAPKSIKLIPDDGFYDRTKQNAPAFIRQVGCTRHLFVLKHKFNGKEMEGLAFRLKALTKNKSINSVIISTVEDNNDDVLGSTLFHAHSKYSQNEPMNSFIMQTNDYLVGTKHAATDAANPSTHYKVEEPLWDAIGSGYDPIKDLYRTGIYKDYDKTYEYLGYCQDLAIAGRGCSPDTVVPSISICDGSIVDSGFGLWLSGSYAIATEDTYYRVLNPSKGLSIDPVGLSFMLPRIGIEIYSNRAKHHAMACAYLLTLTGYECNFMDLMDTGLATHASVHGDPRDLVHTLEYQLQHMPPWNQQAIIRSPVRQYDEIPKYDHHITFRNGPVAETVYASTSFPANANADLWTTEERDHYLIKCSYDPSLDSNPYLPWHMERNSTLLALCELFDNVLYDARSVSDIYDGFEAIANKTPKNDDDDDTDELDPVPIAQEIVQQMKERSPLALSVIFKLLQLGAKQAKENTFQECCSLERIAQTRMYQKPDFETYAKYITQNPGKAIPTDNFWQHKSLKDVSNDEVLEIIQAND